VDFGGVRLRVATPEDLVIYKAVAWRDRDRSDIERLLARHRDTIDLERVRQVVREFAAALDDPARVEQFDALVRRALG
jgi:predicted nucleotidyltransferase